MAKTIFSYENFAAQLREALLQAKEAGHLCDGHAVHLLDNGSELCVFWVSDGTTLASWLGYSDDERAAAQLVALVDDIRNAPAKTVNTFHEFMFHAAVIPTGNASLLEFARPIYSLVTADAQAADFHYVGCELLNPESHITTVLFTTRAACKTAA